jgi:hypothetical protein
MRFKSILYFLLIFFAGSITSSIFEWLAPITTIEVTNSSDKVIRSIDINYTGMGEHKGHLIEVLKPGQRVTFKWTTDGEADYSLRVNFEDGTEVSGGHGYTGRGKLQKEYIEEKRVMSSSPMDFTFGLQFSKPRDTTRPATN